MRGSDAPAHSGLTPMREIARRRWACAQTSKIGTSGHALTYQRALVNTDHADSDGTDSSLTSTTTARGSSSAALMMASRIER